MFKRLVSFGALALLCSPFVNPASVSAQTSAPTMPACAAGDPIVWLTPRNFYHVEGDVAYGRSPNGAYACLSDAKAKGAVQGPSTPMGPGGGQGMNGQGMRGAGGGMMRGGMGAQAGATASATMPACKAADPVVWLTPRNFYFRKGELQYGRSPYGQYLCLSAAKAKGAVHGPNTPMGPGAGRGMGPGMGMAAGTQTAGTGTNSGAAIYARNCAMCHGATGQGVANAFPPLMKSAYVADRTKAAHAVLYGLQGPIVVAGKPYNGAMPAWKGTLSNAEIAAVLTHVRMSWGNAYGPISAAAVASVSK